MCILLVVYIHLWKSSLQRGLSLIWSSYSVSVDTCVLWQAAVTLSSALPYSLALRDTQVHLRVPLVRLCKEPRLHSLENSVRNQDLGAGCACRPGGSPRALQRSVGLPIARQCVCVCARAALPSESCQKHM